MCAEIHKERQQNDMGSKKNEFMEWNKIKMKVRLRVKLTSEVKGVTLEQTGNAKVERNAENRLKNLRHSPETSFLWIAD